MQTLPLMSTECESSYRVWLELSLVLNPIHKLHCKTIVFIVDSFDDYFLDLID